MDIINSTLGKALGGGAGTSVTHFVNILITILRKSGYFSVLCITLFCLSYCLYSTPCPSSDDHVFAR